jgi:hypothetical protein
MYYIQNKIYIQSSFTSGTNLMHISPLPNPNLSRKLGGGYFGSKLREKYFFFFTFTSLTTLEKNCEPNNLRCTNCIYLFITYGLFKGIFIISDYIALTVKGLVNDESERIREKAMPISDLT